MHRRCAMCERVCMWNHESDGICTLARPLECCSTTLLHSIHYTLTLDRQIDRISKVEKKNSVTGDWTFSIKWLKVLGLVQMWKSLQIASSHFDFIQSASTNAQQITSRFLFASSGEWYLPTSHVFASYLKIKLLSLRKLKKLRYSSLRLWTLSYSKIIRLTPVKLFQEEIV